jgi:hypothetical protein
MQLPQGSEPLSVYEQKPAAAKWVPIQMTGPHGGVATGYRDLTSGATTWNAPGMTPYAKPATPKSPTLLTGAEADAAQILGLPLDRSKWNADQTRRASELTTKIMMGRRPVTNVNVAMPVSPTDILPPTPGSTAPGSVLMRDKSGHLVAKPSPLGPPVTKSKQTPQQMIDTEMTRGLASYNAQANADKAGANFIRRMIGLHLPNSHSYAAMSAARKLDANKILPPDIPAGSAFTGRLDDKGRPLYKTPIPGAFAASDAFGGG